MRKISNEELCAVLESLQMDEIDALEQQVSEHPHQFSLHFCFRMHKLLRTEYRKSGPEPVKGTVPVSRMGLIFLAFSLLIEKEGAVSMNLS